jgi:hypothetical protein
MSHNPYAPPTAPVADIITSTSEPGGSRDVERACKLLWVAYWVQQLLGAIGDVISFPDDIGLIVVSSLIAAVIAFFITRWFVLKLRARRNWMRILLASTTVRLVVVSFMFWGRVTSRDAGNLPHAIAFWSQVVIYSVAVLLLFTARSRSWFAVVRHPASYGPADGETRIGT